MADITNATVEFALENNTLSKEARSDPKDKIEVEIGDSRQPDFKPQFKIKRWDNEVNFSIRAKEHPDATVDIDRGVVKYITPDVEVHQYEKPDAGEYGGFEFEWVLKKKPESNVLRTTIQHKGLDFFYQPALSAEEIKQGASRPENVIGSYAVYHQTKRDNIVDGMEYKTGKAFHIYRPHAVDADGVQVWCDLNIAEGELTVTVPEDFLSNAKYPVVVDPTIGYTTQGATDYAIASGLADYGVAWKVAGLAGSTVTKISQFVRSPGTPKDEFKSHVWNDSGSGTTPTETAIPYTSAQTAMTSGSFVLQEITLSYVLTGSVQWIGTRGVEMSGSSTSDIAMDTGGVSGDTSAQDDFGVWGTHASTNRYSVYATYTASPTVSVTDTITLEDFPGYHPDNILFSEQVTAFVTTPPISVQMNDLNRWGVRLLGP